MKAILAILVSVFIFASQVSFAANPIVRLVGRDIVLGGIEISLIQNDTGESDVLYSDAGQQLTLSSKDREYSSDLMGPPGTLFHSFLRLELFKVSTTRVLLKEVRQYRVLGAPGNASAELVSQKYLLSLETPAMCAPPAPGPGQVVAQTFRRCTDLHEIPLTVFAEF